MKITAAYLGGTAQPFELASLDLDPPGPEEVCVRIEATGVCASDAHTKSGRIPSPMPCVLGHEGAGIVEAIGERVSHVDAGDHVALSWMPNCGCCRYCSEGRPVLCADATPHMLAGTLLDGTTRLHRNGETIFHYSFLSTFATYAVVPAASAIRIDPAVPFPVAAVVGCAIMTGYGAAVNRAQVKPGSTVLVYGAGGVGLSAIMGAAVSGAEKIIVVDPVKGKRAVACELGATHTLDPDQDVVAQVRDLTDGYGADYAIDAVGVPAVSSQAFEAVIPGGTLVCVGVPAPDARPSFPGPELVRSERVVTGSLYGSSRPSVDIPKILKLYQAGRLPLDRMVSATYPLAEINTAFADMEAGQLIRGVLIPG